jgi:hypothetical protein
MEEPSVLDYLKSRLPWSKNKEELPTIDDSQQPQPHGPRPPLNLPWRTILALILALIGQYAIDPTGFTFGVDTGNSLRESNFQSALNIGLGFYAMALGFLVWAYFVNEFSLPSVPEDQPQTDPGTVRRGWVILGGVLALVTFLFLGDNLFTPLNVILWLLTLLIFTYGLWLPNPDPDAPSAWTRVKNFFQRDSWQINLTHWTLLLLAVSAVIIFFRFYRLDGVPVEPFSDHAEKLLDVYDITQGQTHIFFERNTGREFLQFYWTALVAFLFNTGLTFMSLKIGTVLIGLLTLPYVYLLGKEIGGKRVALFALILAGVAYWPNIISRIGLRFPLYPVFTAPVLFYLIRGLRTQNRNDFILSGLFLGLGLHGYSSFRFVPFVVLATVGLYLLHKHSAGRRKQVFMLLAVLIVVSILVFLPLFRYAIGRPDMFSERALTRLTDAEHPLPPQDWCPVPGNTATALCIFSTNTAKAMLMPFWDNGSTWVHSVPGRPALDIAAAVLFAFGYVLVFVRYLRERRWQDSFLLLSVPLLLMPSILSIAFPDENPSLNRTGGAYVVIFVIAALALDGIYTAFQAGRSKGLIQGFAVATVIFLLSMSAIQSYDLVFNKFDIQFRRSAWNTSDIGKIMIAFKAEGNSPETNAWVIPFPYWVDTRLSGIQAGLPTKDFAIPREDLPNTLAVTGAKLFIFKDEDQETMAILRNLYPNGLLGMFDSPLEGKDFWIYTVPESLSVAP